MDSELVVKQVLGEYKVKNEGLKPLHKTALRLSEGFRIFRIAHVPRDRNKAADKLSKKAIDGAGASETPSHDPSSSQGNLPF